MLVNLLLAQPASWSAEQSSVLFLGAGEPPPRSPPPAAEGSALSAGSLKRVTAFTQQNLLPCHVHPDAKHIETHHWHNQISPSPGQLQRAPSGAAGFSIPWQENCLIMGELVGIFTNHYITVHWGEKEENKPEKLSQRIEVGIPLTWRLPL